MARARSTILAGLVFCAAPAVGQEGTACAIKGNQSGIYHLPGGRCYAETTIRADNRRERWFCSEEEARAAGFRRPSL
jgi:hypothetical protein